jgi:hypothetical protein
VCSTRISTPGKQGCRSEQHNEKATEEASISRTLKQAGLRSASCSLHSPTHDGTPAAADIAAAAAAGCWAEGCVMTLLLLLLVAAFGACLTSSNAICVEKHT